MAAVERCPAGRSVLRNAPSDRFGTWPFHRRYKARGEKSGAESTANGRGRRCNDSCTRDNPNVSAPTAPVYPLGETGRATERGRAVIVAVWPPRQGAEEAPAVWHLEQTAKAHVAAGTRPGCTLRDPCPLPREDRHDPEGGVAGPVGDGPVLGALRRARIRPCPARRSGRRRRPGRVGEQHDQRPASTRRTTRGARCGASSPRRSWRRSRPTSARALEHHPGRAPGVPGRRGAQGVEEEAVHDPRFDGLVGEAPHHGAAADRLVQLHGAAVHARRPSSGEC